MNVQLLALTTITKRAPLPAGGRWMEPGAQPDAMGKKGKGFQLRAWSRFWGSRRLRLLDLLDFRHYEGGQIVTLTHQGKAFPLQAWMRWVKRNKEERSSKPKCIPAIFPVSKAYRHRLISAVHNLTWDLSRMKKVYVCNYTVRSSVVTTQTMWKYPPIQCSMISEKALICFKVPKLRMLNKVEVST